MIEEIKKTVDFLIARSYASYNENCGKCAKAVREAIEFGFAPKTLDRTESAKDYGPSYEKLGFKLEKITDPGFWYTKGNYKENRQKFQRYKLLEKYPEYKDLSTEEIIIKLKYLKLYNSGNWKFIWKID